MRHQLLTLSILCTACATASSGSSSPTLKPNMTFSYFKNYNKEVVFLDLFETKTLPKNQYVVAYFSGMYEDWRPDSKDFPKESLGKPLDKWPGEREIDATNPKVIEIMKKRIKMAKGRGYPAIDIDNIDRAKDPVVYMKTLSAYAKSLGLKVGQKNAAELDSKLRPYVDFQVIEECFKFKECDRYKHLIQFHIEYTAKSAEQCKRFPTLVFGNKDLTKQTFCK